MSVTPAHETEPPFGDIDINSLDLLFNTLPEDLDRPKLEEIVRISRVLRARREAVEPRKAKEKAEPKAKAEKVSKTKAALAQATSVEVVEEDVGF